MIDPKRPAAVRSYKREKLSPEDLPPDYYALLSLVMGIIGFVMKHKLCAWGALFACMGSIANVKMAQLDMKQMSCSVT
jgi:hypothetical protein